MKLPTDAANAHLRWSIYVLLIAASTGVMLARVMSVKANHGRTPFQSANDRSRWATMRALVDQGTYEIDDVVYQTRDGRILRDEEGIPLRNRDWHTIDMVRHTNRDGVMRSYSSKPTLLPTLLAGVYWVVQKATGNTRVEDDPFYIGRIVLVLVNVLPLVGYFWLMALLIERYGDGDWGRIFAMTLVTFGTFVTTFAVTINNHLPATIAATIAVFAALRICLESDHRWWWFALAGFMGAFTAANELPALSFFLLLGAVLLWRNPVKTLFVGTPAAAIVAIAALATNYIAHDSWKPPYAHRSDGPVLSTITTHVDEVADELDAGRIPHDLRQRIAIGNMMLPVSDEAKIIVEQPGERWRFSDDDEALRYAIVRVGERIEIRHWDRWYVFDGAYWRSGKETKIDLGEPSAWNYAFQCTFGHHGVFSLTPVWLLSIAGLAMLLVGGVRRWQFVAAFVLIISVVVLGFYLSRPQLDRTYGGFTTGLRWMFWFAPMWVLMLLPAVDWLEKSKLGQGIAIALLVLSVFSAFYGSSNPWTHPWIYDYWAHLQWIEP
jgi:hypothetical protein